MTGEKSDQEKTFTTLQRAIAVAAREQGGDPSSNLRLRLAMQRAEEANMPDDAIEQARRQGTGEADGPNLQEVTYEGYGPENVAVFIESITDDKSRTKEELGEIFAAHGGNLGEDGCVAWQFERKGLVEVDAEDVEDADSFMLEVIDMGAEDLRQPLYDKKEGGRVPTYRVYSTYENLWELANGLDAEGYRVHEAAPVLEATQSVGLSSDEARNFLGFNEQVAKHEDVQHVYSNWESK